MEELLPKRVSFSLKELEELGMSLLQTYSLGGGIKTKLERIHCLKLLKLRILNGLAVFREAFFVISSWLGLSRLCACFALLALWGEKGVSPKFFLHAVS